MDEAFVFEDFVTPNQALSISDVTVLPSLKEGFGIVTIESCLFRKLHIRTKTAGYEDLKDCCIGIEVGDSVALAAELGKVMSGNDYSKLIEEAYDYVLANCTVTTMTEKILKVYEAAING